MKKWFALCMLFACDDSVACPSIGWIDGFKVVITDDAWSPQRYHLAVSFEDRGGAHAFECDVQVPVYTWDGGVPIVSTRDGGGLSATENVGCTETVGDTNDGSAQVSIGRELEASFPGTPNRVTLTIDTPQGRLLERVLELDYRTEYPYGRACGGPSSAAVRVALPY